VKLFNEFLGTMLFCIVISLTVGCKSKVNMLNGYAIGCMLMCMVYMGGHLSGGVYNPAVAFALFIRNLIMKNKPQRFFKHCCDHMVGDFISYTIAQSAGALAGGGIVKLITDTATCVGDTVCISYGYPDFGFSKILHDLESAPIATAPKYDFSRAFLAESLGTFILCLTVLHSATCQKKNVNNGFYGLAIGFSVMISIYAFGDVSGGCFNPAVGLLDVLDSSVNPERMECYWSAPFVGAFVAALVFMLLNPDEEEELDEVEADEESGEKTQLLSGAKGPPA
jgi:aquaporin Z